MKKTKTNISVVNNVGIRRDANIHIGDKGPFPSGDILDANAVNELVNSTNTSEILNQLDDVLNSKQDNILDLDTIRSGAAAGATAQLPATTLSGYGITDGYTKTEGQTLESSIDERLDAQDATIALLNGSEVIVVADHTVVATPDSQKIYREQGSTSYTDWMYQNSEWKKIAEYDFPGVDEEPVAGSKNLVQSGGVRTELDGVWHEIDGTIAVGFAQGNIDSSSGAYVNNTNRVRTSSPVNAGRDFKIVCTGDIMINNGVFQYDASHSPDNPGEKDTNWVFVETSGGSSNFEFVVPYNNSFPNSYVVFRRRSSSSSAVTPTDVASNVTFTDSVSIEKHLGEIEGDLTDVQSEITGMNGELDTIQSKIGGVTNKSIQVEYNKPFDETIPFEVPNGRRFKIELSSNDDIWANSVLQDITAYDENGNGTVLAGGPPVFPSYKSFSQEFVAQANYKSIRLFRSAESIAAGTINFTGTVYSVFAEAAETTTRINTVEAEIGTTVNELRAEIGSGAVVVDTISEFTWKTGYYYNANGTMTQNSSSKYTEGIDISAFVGLKVLLIGSFQKTSRYSLITTEDGTVLSGALERAGSTLDLGTITSGAKYLKISINSSSTLTKAEFDVVLVNESNVAEKNSVVYVDAANGSDDYNGSSTAPFATFAKAIDSTGKDTTIVLRGDISESVNIKRKAGQRSLTIIGEKGSLNRIILGTRITEATQYSGDVYYAELESFPSAEQYHIFQHDIHDLSTLITDTERHPLLRGREYRCESTMLTAVASIDAVVESESQKYYWDSTDSRLYFKIASGSNLADNPIVLPASSSRAIYGNDGTVELKMVNIEAWYCSFYLSGCHGAVLQNCASKFAYSAGGFIWDNCIGLKLYQCEASRTFSGSSTGDGFNAHSSYVVGNTENPSVAEARHTTCMMVDCWSHDCNDDGYSDHERCECSIHGGLYEYNGKAGVTPSYGSHLVCYNVISRNNDRGFYYAGSATVEEGGKYGQIVCFNCVAENHTKSANNSHIGSGFVVDSGYNMARFVNCKSINNTVGYNVSDNSEMELIDCSAKDCTTIKSGNVVINNTTLVVGE